MALEEHGTLPVDCVLVVCRLKESSMLLETPGEGITLVCFIARVRDTRTVRTEDRLTFVLEPNIVGGRTVKIANGKDHIVQVATHVNKCLQ